MKNTKLIATHVDLATHWAIHVTARATGGRASTWLRQLIKEGLARDKPQIIKMLNEEQKQMLEQALST